MFVDRTDLKYNLSASCGRFGVVEIVRKLRMIRCLEIVHTLWTICKFESSTLCRRFGVKDFAAGCCKISITLSL